VHWFVQCSGSGELQDPGSVFTEPERGQRMMTG
jgi:hypothetical protein